MKKKLIISTLLYMLFVGSIYCKVYAGLLDEKKEIGIVETEKSSNQIKDFIDNLKEKRDEERKIEEKKLIEQSKEYKKYQKKYPNLKYDKEEKIINDEKSSTKSKNKAYEKAIKNIKKDGKKLQTSFEDVATAAGKKLWDFSGKIANKITNKNKK